MSCLSSLIGHSNLSSFWSEVFERRFRLYAASLDSRFEFSLRDFETILSLPGVRPYLRLVNRQSEDWDPRIVTQRGHLCKPYVLKSFFGGASIVINEIHRFHPALMSFVSGLSEDLGISCVANAYLTPKESVALSPHFDSHDIFAIQISGHKEWFVEPEPPSPVSLSTFQPVLAVDDPRCSRLATVQMRVGDVMYLPRGCVHHAQTISDYSLHLTIGLYPIELGEFIGILVDSLAAVSKDFHWHRTIPLGSRRPSLSDLKEILAHNLVDALSDDVVDEAFRRCQKKLSENQPSDWSNVFRFASSSAHIPLEDVRLKRCAEPVFTSPTPGGLRIVSSGFGFTILHPEPDYLVALLTTENVFSVREIRQAGNCSLLDLSVVQHLLERGILVAVS